MIGTSPVTGGAATFATNAVTASHTITAGYAGDPNYAAVTSAGLKQSITDSFGACTVAERGTPYLDAGSGTVDF